MNIAYTSSKGLSVTDSLTSEFPVAGIQPDSDDPSHYMHTYSTSDDDCAS